jgi:hypothetical protein
LQRLGHSDVPSWPNPRAGDSAVASPVNAQPRNKFLLLIGQFENGVNDALGDGGFGGEEGAGDLVGSEADEETEGEGWAGLDGGGLDGR